MNSEITALERQRAAYRAFIQADGERANAESQAKAREVAVEEEIRGENSRNRHELEARQTEEEKAEKERGTKLRTEENQATAQREAELNKASRARIEELERLKQQAESRAKASQDWVNERLRDARNAVNEVGVLIVKTLGRQMDKLSPTAVTATGNPELGLEQAALVARKGVTEIRDGLLRLESAVRTKRQRLLACCIAMVAAVVVAGAVVAYQIPSTGKTARRLFNQYQAELNAAYGKNDMERLKTAYGLMLKDAEKEQIKPENFRQGLKPSWYNELLPGILDGARPGALKDFAYYGRIYAYLSKTMRLSETRGLVEECWREKGLERTECKVNGKIYTLTPDSIVFSKDKKVLTGEIGEILTGVKCALRYEGEDAQVIQIIGSRNSSQYVRKDEQPRQVKFSVVDMTALFRQAEADMRAGKLQKALAGYKEAQAINSGQAGLKEKIANIQERLLVIKAQADRVVTDAVTGLEWVVGSDQDTDYAQAEQWVTTNGIAGGGWRMPTKSELKTLYHPGMGMRNMDPAFMTTGWFVWAEPQDSSSAWAFAFGSGNENCLSRDVSSSGRVFGVRSRPR